MSHFRQRRRAPSVEPLERRDVPSTLTANIAVSRLAIVATVSNPGPTVWLNAPMRTVTIQGQVGTARNDAVVAYDPTSLFRVHVRLTAPLRTVTETFDVRQVDKIIFRGSDGDDKFDNWTIIPSEASGGRGNDELFGGFGRDSLDGGLGHDFLKGRDGIDYLFGMGGNDILHGGDGNDILLGDNWLPGNPVDFGHDLIIGGHGDDILVGNDGDDWLFGFYRPAPPGVIDERLYPTPPNRSLDWDDDGLVGGEGVDYLWDYHGKNKLHGEGGGDTLQGSGYLYGGDGDDTLRGSFEADVLMGQGGRDKLHGQEGRDFLVGGSEDFVLDGGQAADVLIFVGPANSSGVNWSMLANIEGSYYIVLDSPLLASIPYWAEDHMRTWRR